MSIDYAYEMIWRWHHDTHCYMLCHRISDSAYMHINHLLELELLYS